MWSKSLILSQNTITHNPNSLQFAATKFWQSQTHTPPKQAAVQKTYVQLKYPHTPLLHLRQLELSLAAKNYRLYMEKHSAMRQPIWPWVFMPHLMLVRISPGDKILLRTGILMEQITKAQRVTLNNSTNAEAEEEKIAGWENKGWPKDLQVGISGKLFR